jgi:hypothetical protein
MARSNPSTTAAEFANGAAAVRLSERCHDERLFRLPAVAERFKERHERVLVRVGQSKVSRVPHVHVDGHFRSGPATNSLAWIIRLGARQRVACVVEMDDFFQAFEIAAMSASLDESRVGPLVDVARGRHLNAANVLVRVRDPTRISD